MPAVGCIAVNPQPAYESQGCPPPLLYLGWIRYWGRL